MVKLSKLLHIMRDKMTRDQGYQIYYTIFEQQDDDRHHYNYEYFQKLILSIPLVLDEGTSHTYFPLDVFDLIDLLRIEKKNDVQDRYISFWDAEDSQDYGEVLTGYFPDFLTYINTRNGKHAILYTLAHNANASNIFKDRIQQWDHLINAYRKKEINKESIFYALYSWPIQFGIQGVPRLFCPYYPYTAHQKRIVDFYKQIKNELFNDSITKESQMVGIANYFRQAVNIKNEYEERRLFALSCFGETYCFDGQTPWSTEKDDLLEEILHQIKSESTKIHNDNKEILDNTKQIPTMGTSVAQMFEETKNTLKNIQDEFKNPEVKIFRYGIECGALAPPIGEDLRYIIYGQVGPSIKKWFEFLRDKKHFKRKDIPKSSSLKNRLRRAPGALMDIEQETRLIGERIEKVKSEMDWLE